MHFKSSTNRTPAVHAGHGGRGAHAAAGTEAAGRRACSVSNAGKSTLIRAVSAATPKVADIRSPRCTRTWRGERGAGARFAIADIPGLIEGAADGAGLGARSCGTSSAPGCCTWWEIEPLDGGDAVDQIRTIERELEMPAGLLDKPRWLLLNKADLIPADSRTGRAHRLRAGLTAPGLSSGLAHEGTREVMLKVQAYLDELARVEREA